MKSPFCEIDSKVNILRQVSGFPGTTANLKGGDSLSVKQLLYGMMLPSGNDAAQSLGIYFGLILLNNGKTDPNLAFQIAKETSDKKVFEIRVQYAFNFSKKQHLVEKKTELPKRMRGFKLKLK